MVRTDSGRQAETDFYRQAQTMVDTIHYPGGSVQGDDADGIQEAIESLEAELNEIEPALDDLRLALDAVAEPAEVKEAGGRC